MVAVRVLETMQVWDPTICSMVKIGRGQRIEGDQAVFLLASAARHVEVVLDTPPPVLSEPGTAPEVTESTDDATVPANVPALASEPTEFDPSQHSGAAVIAYAKEHPEQSAAIRAAENNPVTGKRRTGVLVALSTD